MTKKFFKILIIAVLTLLSVTCVFAGCGEKTPPKQENVSVNFVNYDGTVLAITSVKAGKVPSYTGQTPVRESTASTEYVFCGWEYNGTVYPSLPAVNKNTIFTASYTESAKKYQVTFDIGGNLYKKDYEYGQIPSWDGDTEFEIDGSYYVISQWNKPFGKVTTNTTYVATLTLKEGAPEGFYEITFIVDEDSITETVKENSIPKFFGTPYRKERLDCYYEFTGWSDGVEVYTPDKLPIATQDAEYVAVFQTIYKTFNVEFKSDGVTVWQTQTVYGQTPVFNGSPVQKLQDEKYVYSFDCWSRYGEKYDVLPKAYQDMVFEAVFTKTLRTYKLTVNYLLNGQIIQSNSQNFTYGDDYVISSPEVEGYSASKPYVSGSITKDEVINVEYLEFSDWYGEYSSPTLLGKGTEESPYIISNANQLAQLAKDVDLGVDYSGKYFKLTTDVNLRGLDFDAIGSYSNAFAGVFDGSGHIVYNLEYKNEFANSDQNSGHALFSTITGMVKNLSVSGNVKSVAKYTALVVGYNKGGNVINCSSYGTVTGFGNVGGIVGYNAGNIKDCVNYAEIKDDGNSSAYRFGGIAGCTTGNLENCLNKGKVYVVSGTGSVGGIVGKKEASAKITNCYNYAYVYSTKSYTAGIIGYADGASEDYSNLYNYAPISGANYTAGIIAYVNGSNVSLSQNYGFIKGSGYVGGIVGYTNCDVSKCDNLGGISATSTYSAGVVARTLGSTYDCVNKGDVFSKSTSVGGVVGYMGTNTALEVVNRVKNCDNFGSVTTTSTGNVHVGGVIGYSVKATVGSSYVKPFVEECVNYGQVSTNGNYTGGVIGACNGSIIQGCQNYASVLAEKGTYVGGIAGSNWGYGSVLSCVNYGAVLGGSTVGQICGQLTDTSTASGNESKGMLL